MTSYVLGWGSLALINAAIANGDGRSPLKYFLASLFFGPFARELRERIAAAGGRDLDPETHRALLGQIRAFSEASLNDKTELFPPGAFLAHFRLGGILRLLAREMLRRPLRAH